MSLASGNESPPELRHLRSQRMDETTSFPVTQEFQQGNIQFYGDNQEEMLGMGGTAQFPVQENIQLYGDVQEELQGMNGMMPFPVTQEFQQENIQFYDDVQQEAFDFRYGFNTGSVSLMSLGPDPPEIQHESNPDQVRMQELEKSLMEDDDDNQEWKKFLQFSPFLPSCDLSPQQVLVHAATAIEEGDFQKANEFLIQNSEMHVTGSAERVNSMISSALIKLMGPDHGPCPSTPLCCFISPCMKLALWTANMFILDCTSYRPCMIHVVDFNSGYGGFGEQYSNLIELLGYRQKGRLLTLKITVISDFGDIHHDVDRLKRLGHKNYVTVEINFMDIPPAAFTREVISCNRNEALVVNMAYYMHRVPDESVRVDNPRDELLRRVKQLGPRLVTLVEHEMDINTVCLSSRVGEVYEYYDALFDSLGSCPSFEELKKRVSNAITCEGAARVERCEVFDKWCARMAMAGLALKPIAPEVIEDLQTRVGQVPEETGGFSVKYYDGGLAFCWNGKVLVVFSTWY